MKWADITMTFILGKHVRILDVSTLLLMKRVNKEKRNNNNVFVKKVQLNLVRDTKFI